MAPETVAEPVPPPASSAALGTLLVKSSPYAQIRINGKPRGNTPTKVQLPPGRYVVDLDCGPCEPARSEQRTVTLSSGDTQRIQVSFEP